jgi:hypothetical protein
MDMGLAAGAVTVLGTFLANRLIQSEVVDEIAHLCAGQKARVEAVEEKAEFGGFLEFLGGIDGSLEIVPGNDRTVIGQ